MVLLVAKVLMFCPLLFNLTLGWRQSSHHSRIVMVPTNSKTVLPLNSWHTQMTCVWYCESLQYHPARTISKAILILSHPTHDWKEERLKDMRIRALTAFLTSSGHLLDRILTDDEWCDFVMRSDALLDELGMLKAAHPPRNPTTH